MKTGELIIGAVINRTASGMMLKVLCTAAPTPRYVADINVKVFMTLHMYMILHNYILKTVSFRKQITCFGRISMF